MNILKLIGADNKGFPTLEQWTRRLLTMTILATSPLLIAIILKLS